MPNLSAQRTVSSKEVLGWCVLLLAVVVARVVFVGPWIANDSYQYLSAVGNALSGNFAQTSIVHFDIERSWGRIPAPLTTFPAAYPLVVAALAKIGLAPERAAIVVSIAALVALIPLLSGLCRKLGLEAMTSRAVFAALVVSASAGVFGTFIGTESLFTLLIVASLLSLCTGLQQAGAQGSSEWPLFKFYALGNLLLGLAYWTRNAGLFFVASVGFFFVVRALWRRKAAVAGIAALAVSCALVGAGLLRNQLLVGNWKGGNEKAVFHVPLRVLMDLVPAVYHALIGDAAPGSVRALPELMLLLGMLLAFCVVLYLLIKQQWVQRIWQRGSEGLLLLICAIGVYLCAMVYAGVTTVISFGPRMFYPILPLLLMLVAWLVQQIVQDAQQQRTFRALAIIGAALLFVGYTGLNLRSYWVPPTEAPHAAVLRAFDEPRIDDAAATIGQWIQREVGPAETVFGTRGQALGYVLQRPTVSLVSSAFSSTDWNEQTLLEQMKRFHARRLIIFLDSPQGGLQELKDSAFMTAVAAGTLPAWLSVAARSADVLVLDARY